MPIKLLAIYLLLEVSLFVPALHAGDITRVAEIETLRKAALAAVEIEATAKAYNGLFNYVDGEVLAELTRDPDTGIALYAWWQSHKSKDLHVAAASHPERFVGFLEGRTGLTCPTNWASWLTLQSDFSKEAFLPGAIHLYEPLGLIRTRIGDDGNKRLSGLAPSVEKLQKIRIGPHEVQVPVGTRVKNGWIEVGTKSLPLHPSLIKALQRLRIDDSGDFKSDACRVLIEDRATYVVFHSFGSEIAHTLFCLEARSGAVAWKADVWTATDMGYAMFGNWSYQPVELATSREVVAVFGVYGHYVEAFDIATGKPVFRFNPRLWDNPLARDNREVAAEEAAAAAKRR